jgi:hypothetical protein
MSRLQEAINDLVRRLDGGGITAIDAAVVLSELYGYGIIDEDNRIIPEALAEREIAVERPGQGLVGQANPDDVDYYYVVGRRA